MANNVGVRDLDPTSQERLTDLFKVSLKYARYGDVGCILPTTYKNDADNFGNMTVRPDDVWVATFPRTGTTWTQELVWVLKNDFDYDTAAKIPLMGRYFFLELPHIAEMDEKQVQQLDAATIEMLPKMFPSYEVISKAPSPRFIKTHLPFSLLPSNLLDTTKVVYVARDPRDVAVSFYHHNRRFLKYAGDFKTYWNLFIEDLVLYTPFFPHLKEAWALRDHPNLLFIFYEDMIKDLPSCIKRIANFFGKEPTNEQIAKLCDHLDIKNFRNNESVNPLWMDKVSNSEAEGFVRKGKSGGWREHFDEEMAAQAQKWITQNLAGSDLRFPSSPTQALKKMFESL